ncbi:AAA-type ATPase family protein [Actinidia rufa]|uniref:AAA-type ATPase family protein n=1 Tax=Actinidia rufa TaxID=165716 RepID=A0A7J0E6J5_9ERIC|nr:AAA-type ATPase family protein [Actinidia rufa]
MAIVCGAAASAGLISALASAELGSDHAYASADGPFNFSPFFSSSPSAPSPVSPVNADQPPRVRNDNPRTTSVGFDPEALERGAKALREINTSSHSKKVIEVMKKSKKRRGRQNWLQRGQILKLCKLKLKQYDPHFCIKFYEFPALG